MNFDVDRTDFRHTRLAEQATRDLTDGEVELELESFAFTANNISYASAGDFLDYWGFFPTDAPWGRIPVMGIGRVTRSANPDIAVGGRYFGFFPMTDRHIVQASPSSEGFVDRAEHRAKHAAAYRSFNRVDDDPAYHPATEGQYLIARGLFITSFLVDDFLGEQGFFGADQVIVTSASSRTSIALAHRLRARGGVHVVGLTAERNRSFVEQVGLYDEVLAYDQIDAIDATRTSVVVDMAGNVEVLAQVHTHVGPNLSYSCRVGATHWDAGGSAAAMPGPTPTFFFAPSQIKKRSQEWGREQFDRTVATALAGFLDHAAGWMRIERSSGTEAVEAVYRSTLDGTGDPAVGHILSMTSTASTAQ
jgi:NAD(P)-dependent dehydrogenase (short-subunit alcohol dehydrogenase family)